MIKIPGLRERHIKNDFPKVNAPIHCHSTANCFSIRTMINPRLYDWANALASRKEREFIKSACIATTFAQENRVHQVWIAAHNDALPGSEVGESVAA